MKTDKELYVINDGKGVVDDKLINDADSIRDMGYSISHRRIGGANHPDSLMTLNMDDESSREERVKRYVSISDVSFLAGDDSTYVMRNNITFEKPGARGDGNGAQMHLGVR